MMTGEQYKTSLNDGRATFFEGRRVDDLPGHPVLGQCVEVAPTSTTASTRPSRAPPTR